MYINFALAKSGLTVVVIHHDILEHEKTNERARDHVLSHLPTSSPLVAPIVRKTSSSITPSLYIPSFIKREMRQGMRAR